MAGPIPTSLPYSVITKPLDKAERLALRPRSHEQKKEVFKTPNLLEKKKSLDGSRQIGREISINKMWGLYLDSIIPVRKAKSAFKGFLSTRNRK